MSSPNPFAITYQKALETMGFREATEHAMALHPDPLPSDGRPRRLLSRLADPARAYSSAPVAKRARAAEPEREEDDDEDDEDTDEHEDEEPATDPAPKKVKNVKHKSLSASAPIPDGYYSSRVKLRPAAAVYGPDAEAFAKLDWLAGTGAPAATIAKASRNLARVERAAQHDRPESIDVLAPEPGSATAALDFMATAGMSAKDAAAFRARVAAKLAAKAG